MAFTTVTITGNWGASAAGTVTFTLTQPMANADVIEVPEPIVATLSGGAISQALSANTDPATVPQGVVYGVTEQITGAQPRDFFIEVPGTASETNGSTTNGSNLVQLSSVTAMLWMVGLGVTGSGIPVNTTVTGIVQGSNQLKLSNNATATATGVALTIGSSSIDLSTLMPGDVGFA